ncbi:MAG: hypothetical protein AAFX04_12660 [Pseudomonadota bacterium]
MIPVTCFVQQGQIDPDTVAALREELGALTQSAFDGEAMINWIEVRPGNGFTEAKPSTSSLVSIQSPQALAQPERITILQRICDLWMEKTTCSINEIVASINDPAQ